MRAIFWILPLLLTAFLQAQDALLSVDGAVFDAEASEVVEATELEIVSVPVGMVNRVPRDETALANIHQGAITAATQLDEDEQRAIEIIAPFLRSNGLFLVGADFIGGKLTELNVTSPSAVRQINAVSDDQVHIIIVDAMLAQIGRARAKSESAWSSRIHSPRVAPVSPFHDCCVSGATQQ